MLHELAMNMRMRDRRIDILSGSAHFVCTFAAPLTPSQASMLLPGTCADEYNPTSAFSFVLLRVLSGYCF
jgi:hypothetical protein